MDSSSSSSPKPGSYPQQPQAQHSSRLQSPQSRQPAPTSAKWLPHEERLRKTWRMIGTSVANSMSKADKASKEPQAKRDLDESVVFFLRSRREFHRLLSHAEAKLQGKAEEMESLETYVRTQPRIGKRKRKR